MPGNKVTVRKAAQMIGCHPQWVHKLIDQGKLDAEKVDPEVINSDYQITVSSIERYIREKQKQSK